MSISVDAKEHAVRNKPSPAGRVLVVGGGGFIGTHFVRELLASGRSEILVTGRSPRPRFPLPAGVAYVNCDISDHARMQELLEDRDEVVDLAYSTVPMTSYTDPLADLIANLYPTVYLLKSASQSRLRKFLLVSSGGTVYGNAPSTPINETCPTRPISPYGITKLAAENYARMFHHLENLPAVIARPGNPYGPYQFGNVGQGFVGAAIFATLNRTPVTIFGKQGTTRDYIFVEDLARGLVSTLDAGIPGEIYNIGTGTGCNNLEILDSLDRISTPAGYPVIRNTLPARPFDVNVNILDSSKLQKLSGWKPRYTLDDGLALTWEWARDTLRPGNHRTPDASGT